MNVQDVMTTDVRTCNPEMNLAAAAGIMWEADCGSLPVVDNDQHVLGVITDRDICMAAAMYGKAPSELTVGDISFRSIFYCKPEDDVKAALEVMGQQKVRRLPVVNELDELQGVLSVNDLLLNASEGKRKKGDLPAADVLHTLKSISEHWHPGAADDPQYEAIVEPKA